MRLGLRYLVLSPAVVLCLALAPRPAAAAADDAVALCDRLTASSYDTTRPATAPGVRTADLDGPRGVSACAEALRIQPENPRLEFQLGRALDKIGRNPEAVAWFRKAAEAGHAGGMAGLGFMLANGRGVTKNDAEATAWFHKAAAAGDTEGMADLGFMLENGRGVTKNAAEAVAWYRKAADAGDATGMYDLGRMLELGSGTARNDAEAVAWYRKAAEAGSIEAMMGLARLA